MQLPSTSFSRKNISLEQTDSVDDIPSTPQDLQLEINRLENINEDLEDEFKKKSSRVMSGQIAFGIGLVGIILLSIVWWLWIFLMIIGILTWLSNIGKKNEIAGEIKSNKAKIRRDRDLLITMQSK